MDCSHAQCVYISTHTLCATYLTSKKNTCPLHVAKQKHNIHRHVSAMFVDSRLHSCLPAFHFFMQKIRTRHRDGKYRQKCDLSVCDLEYNATDRSVAWSGVDLCLFWCCWIVHAQISSQNSDFVHWWLKAHSSLTCRDHNSPTTVCSCYNQELCLLLKAKLLISCF